MLRSLISHVGKLWTSIPLIIAFLSDVPKKCRVDSISVQVDLSSTAESSHRHLLRSIILKPSIQPSMILWCLPPLPNSARLFMTSRYLPDGSLPLRRRFVHDKANELAQVSDCDALSVRPGPFTLSLIREPSEFLECRFQESPEYLVLAFRFHVCPLHGLCFHCVVRKASIRRMRAISRFVL